MRYNYWSKQATHFSLYRLVLLQIKTHFLKPKIDHLVYTSPHFFRLWYWIPREKDPKISFVMHVVHTYLHFLLSRCSILYSILVHINFYPLFPATKQLSPLYHCIRVNEKFNYVRNKVTNCSIHKFNFISEFFQQVWYIILKHLEVLKENDTLEFFIISHTLLLKIDRKKKCLCYCYWDPFWENYWF